MTPPIAIQRAAAALPEHKMSSPRRRSTLMGDSASQELERYVKYMYFKAAQVIVQSRQGEKIATLSNPKPSSQTWFCVTINDIPEIYQQSKSAVLSLEGKSVLSYPLCIEISLKTAEGDSMILENWTLAMEDGPDFKCASNVIYNKMSVMLKSLICVTRSVPAYRLSRKQGPESFVICYRIFVGEPSSSVLGEGYQSCPVGHVMTGLGTLTLKVDYRTSMTISPSHPTNTSSETSSNLSSHMMMKSDHFDSDHHHGGSHAFYQNSNNNNNTPANKPRRCDSFGARVSGDEFEPQITSDESGEAMRIFTASPQERPSYLTDNFENHIVKFGAFASQNQATPPPLEDKDPADLDNLMDLFTVEEDQEASDPTTDEVESKLSNLGLQNRPEPPLNREDLRRTQSEVEIQAREMTPMRPRAGSSPRSGPQLVSGAFSQRMKSNEDFEILDLKTPFSAKMGDPTGDLGVFFREPPLKTINEVVDSSPISSQLRGAKPRDTGIQGARKTDLPQENTQEVEEEEEETSELGYLTSHLSQQLHTYESRLAEYDDMLKNLETSESESEPV